MDRPGIIEGMPTRKQRRRREKELRHDYELVWEDAEGNELEPDELPENGAPSSPKAAKAPTRGGRQVQPPSWQRTLKRALIFAPIMFITVTLLSRDLSMAQKLIQTAIIVAIFIPFSYVLDGFMWRTQRRRAARERAAGKRG